MTNSTNASYLALAGFLGLILSHFGFIIKENEIVIAITGIVALIGICRQMFVTKKIVGAANKLGATGFR